MCVCVCVGGGGGGRGTQCIMGHDYHAINHFSHILKLYCMCIGIVPRLNTPHQIRRKLEVLNLVMKSFLFPCSNDLNVSMKIHFGV